MNGKVEPHKCLNCRTRKDTAWRDLDERELGRIDRFKHVRDYNPGDILFHQGDPCKGVYCVQSGLIGMRQVDAEGKEVLVRLSNPGETIGYRALLSKIPHSHFAEVLAPSHICFIDGRIVHELLHNNPSVGERFLNISLSELDEIEQTYVRKQTLDVRARFLHFLMVFYERTGRPDGQGGHMLDIPISRKDLAALIGATPESISRLINNLHAEGLVSISGRQAGFADMEAILEEIGLHY